MRDSLHQLTQVVAEMTSEQKMYFPRLCDYFRSEL